MLPVGSFVIMSAMMVAGYSIAFFFASSFVAQISYRLIAEPNNRFWVVKERERPAALDDSELGTHRYFKTKNITLHYVENGVKSKPLLLLLHGFPEFWYSWRHQLKEFSSDYWVVAMDLRGYGESEKPDGIEHYNVHLLVEDILDLVKGLGREKFTLVGIDWGGIISWYFVMTYPQYLNGYVIMNSAHPYVMQQFLNTELSQIQRSWYMFFFQSPYLPELSCTIDDMAYLNTTLISSSTKTPPSITHEDLECYKYNYGLPGAFTTAINLYRANLNFDQSQQLLNIGDPTTFPHGLLLFGDGDKILDLLQEESAKMAPNTKLIYIPNASHFVQQDDPAAVNRHMRSFLSSLQ